MAAVAMVNVPEGHLSTRVTGCQDVKIAWTELHLIDFTLVSSESVHRCWCGGGVVHLLHDHRTVPGAGGEKSG